MQKERSATNNKALYFSQHFHFILNKRNLLIQFLNPGISPRKGVEKKGHQLLQLSLCGQPFGFHNIHERAVLSLVSLDVQMAAFPIGEIPLLAVYDHRSDTVKGEFFRISPHVIRDIHRTDNHVFQHRFRIGHQQLHLITRHFVHHGKILQPPLTAQALDWSDRRKTIQPTRTIAYSHHLIRSQ